MLRLPSEVMLPPRRPLGGNGAATLLARDWTSPCIITTPTPHHPTSSNPPMCGIFFSLGRDEHVLPDDNTEQLLKNRGPDSKGTQRKTITTEQDSELYATFISTVLSLRGASIVEQPLRDTASQSVLCWNGEAWAIGDRAIDGNDSQRVFDALLDVCRETSLERSYSTQKVVNLLSSVKGPFAFTFYDAANGYIYYGRDCLGRRSLLRKSTHNNTLVLSSICDNATGEQWSEVEADGLYVVDVKSPSLDITHIPHRLKKDETTALLSFVGKSLTTWEYTDSCSLYHFPPSTGH